MTKPEQLSSNMPIESREQLHETLNSLTPRRKQVLELVLAEVPDKDIAESLGIQESTIRKHLERLYQDFHANKRVELVTLFAKYMPELIGASISEESEEIKSQILQNEQFLSEEAVKLEFPEGQVGLNSQFYIQRPPIESRCYETVLQTGCLLRIKAAQKMGKTSLMTRILADAAANQGYATVYLNLVSLEESILTDLDKLLSWFCLMVGKQLKLENKLEDYWDKELLTSNDNCTEYFEQYLLAQINSPLLVALDGVERIFPQAKIAQDFFGLLRSWHEMGKNSESWGKLRLAIAHSTEAYIPLSINYSPFNVGLSIELPEFTLEQVRDLGQRHGLNWQKNKLEQIMDLVGGHPYLVRLALYHLASESTTLQQLLADAPTEAGIYSNHLLRQLEGLKEQEKEEKEGLLDGMKAVVTATEPVQLEATLGFKLDSMGLVKRVGNKLKPRCELYRLYFRDRLINEQ